MIFKIKAITILILCIYFTAQAAEINVPLPMDAVLMHQKGPFMGPMKTVHKKYVSSLNKDKLEAFFKKEMPARGWKEDRERKMTFIKGSDLVIFVINDYKNSDGKTAFIVTSSKLLQTEELLAMEKKNPDKLNFMPIYPGSQQLFLWDSENGVSAQYAAMTTIKEVAFFYKSGMLGYGWELSAETPILTEKLNCKECKKFLPSNMKDAPDLNPVQKQSTLVFKRGKTETCTIKITGAELQDSPAKTNISVLYNVFKKVGKF